MRGDPYGSHRVISPKGLLPQAAERVDNSPTICSNEILIDVIALQPTATAFGRIKHLRYPRRLDRYHVVPQYQSSRWDVHGAMRKSV